MEKILAGKCNGDDNYTIFFSLTHTIHSMCTTNTTHVYTAWCLPEDSYSLAQAASAKQIKTVICDEILSTYIHPNNKAQKELKRIWKLKRKTACENLLRLKQEQETKKRVPVIKKHIQEKMENPQKLMNDENT